MRFKKKIEIGRPKDYELYSEAIEVMAIPESVGRGKLEDLVDLTLYKNQKNTEDICAETTRGSYTCRPLFRLGWIDILY
jgi:hypothetical protein